MSSQLEAYKEQQKLKWEQLGRDILFAAARGGNAWNEFAQEWSKKVTDELMPPQLKGIKSPKKSPKPLPKPVPKESNSEPSEFQFAQQSSPLTFTQWYDLNTDEDGNYQPYEVF